MNHSTTNRIILIGFALLASIGIGYALNAKQASELVANMPTTESLQLNQLAQSEIYSSFPDWKLNTITKEQILGVARTMPAQIHIGESYDCDDATRALYMAIKTKYPDSAFGMAIWDQLSDSGYDMYPWFVAAKADGITGPHATCVAVVPPQELIIVEAWEAGPSADNKMFKTLDSGYKLRWITLF